MIAISQLNATVYCLLTLSPQFSTFTYYIVSTYSMYMHQEMPKAPTNVQDCHNMSKLYFLHLRPLGLHGIFLVVKSQLYQVAMRQPRRSQEPPTTLYHPACPRSGLSQVAMGQLETYREPLTTLHHPASPRSELSKLPWHNRNLIRVVLSSHGTTSHYLSPLCQSQVQKQQQLRYK